MNDEIKEILDKLRSDDYYEKEYQKSVYYERDLKKLEDYITNLQQENEKLNQRNIAGIQVVVSGETYNEYKRTLQDQISELENRIEKAVEYGNSCINKDLDLETLDEPYKTTFKTAYEIHNNYLDILNGRSDE